ncbi:endo-1,4-beta-xylanase [Andreprevotia lacus]|nr:endo-1,4-beta-xylanase [Andreprevotia lacus]
MNPRLALAALALSAGIAHAAPQGERPVFLGQHILYNRTFDGLQDNLFDGLRIWGAEGTTWREIEPQKGQFDFKRFDEHVAAAQARHLPLMHTLGQTPLWASARPDEQGNTGPGAAAEPADMEDWARYVRTVATRYKGKISAYEVMNEPRVPEAVKVWSPGFFSGSAAKLAELTRITATEVRRIDPTAKIVCPSMDGFDGLKRLDAFLKTGAGQYCDVIGFHYYLPRQTVKELRDMVEETNRIKAGYGLAKTPVWDTETGVIVAEAGYNLQPKFKEGPLSKSFQSDDAARLAAKMLVVSHNLGVERTYWFAHDTSWMGSTMADKRQNRLNNFGRALAVLHGWLGGRYLRNCTDAGTAMSCEVYDGKSKLGAIYWGPGKPSAAWSKEGYSRIEFLDGTSTTLTGFDPATTLPRMPDDVVLLR